MKLKNGRWVKIHEQGKGNFESHNNIMDITVGGNRAQADVTYTASTATCQKAAYWMLRYLGHASAEDILKMAAEEIQKQAAAAGKDASEVEVSGDGWACQIEKMARGVFKASLTWTFEAAPVEAPAPKPAAKRRGRKPKVAAAAA